MQSYHAHPHSPIAAYPGNGFAPQAAHQPQYAQYQPQSHPAYSQPAPTSPVTATALMTSSVPVTPKTPASAVNAGTTTITINGTQYAGDSLTPTMTLAEFIRTTAGLKGTKVSCNEGGCGACLVMLSWTGADGVVRNHSINSCLRPAVACDGMSITTIEGFGSSKTGYHPIQQRLAEANGTQCGYCSPGMVINMMDVVTNNTSPSPAAVEQSFDGNLCRCTGYRPILDAMKSFCSSSKPEAKPSAHIHGVPNRCIFPEIEDVPKCCGKCDEQPPQVKLPETKAHVSRKGYVNESDNLVWVDCTTQSYLATLLNQYAGRPTMLVVGHTSVGVNKYYQWTEPQVYINIAACPDFYTIQNTASSLTVGAAVSINEVIVQLQIAEKNSSAPYNLPMIIAHLNRVAHHNVRNIGSIGGNLMLAWYHQTPADSFPSDVMISLIGIGATITVSDTTLKQTALSGEQFLATPMAGKWIVSITIPTVAASGEVYRSYKTALRHVNAHAIVNAAMRATVDPTTQAILGQPVIAYGGIQGAPTRMTNTENAMIGMKVNDLAAFQTLCNTLLAELNVTPQPGRVQYRTSLALSYLYKFFLSMQPNPSPALVLAAEPWMVRAVSSGTQSWQPNPAEFPVNQAIPKISAQKQTSGEALYSGDIREPQGTLHLAFVQSTIAAGTVASIDPSQALAAPGVVGFIPTDGSGTPLEAPIKKGVEAAPITVGFVGQPLGFIVADTADHATAAIELVVVNYTGVTAGIFTIDDAIAANSFWPFNPASQGLPVEVGNPSGALASAPNTVQGSAVCGGQYHFYMETQTCMAVPLEDDKLQLHHATQMQQIVQQSIAAMLGIPMSKVDIETRRCGGGYGGKIMNSLPIAAATAFAAWKYNVPVKGVLGINTCTEMLGGRTPYRADYEVGFDNTGRLSVVTMMIYANGGAGDGGVSISTICANIDNVYSIPNWSINGKICKTNQPMSTSVRGPGWVPATYIMEYIMNHVGRSLGLSGTALNTMRQSNFYAKGDTSPTGDTVTYFNMPNIWSQIQQSSTFQDLEAQVQAFNAANKFRTRGLSLVPVKFQVGYGQNFTTFVSVLADGSVQFSTGGIEIGQGLDTKVAQVIAKQLGCPLSAIDIMTATTNTHSVNQVTGGSMSSELCCLAAINACGPINQSLSIARTQCPANSSFATVAAKATGMGLPLWNEASSNSPAPSQGTANYNSYSAALALIELDVLTGETEVQRVDILFDCGVSLSPLIDIGQIEGGFMMGLGYYMTEERTYMNGSLLNNGTWEYKPPSALDIPVSFNITLLKNAPNPNGVLGSKATGEPPLCGSCCTIFAVEDALGASLNRRGKGTYTLIEAPGTVDKIQLAANVTISDFTFN